MSVRARCDAIGLSSLYTRFSIAARPGIRLRNETAELDPRIKFDVIVQNLTGLDCMLLKNTAVEYAKQNPLAVIPLPHEICKEYARILCKLTSVGQGSSAMSSSTVSRNKTPSDSVTPSAFRDQMDPIHIRNNNVPAQILDTPLEHAVMWHGRPATIKAAELTINLGLGTRPVRSIPYCQGPAKPEQNETEIKKMLTEDVSDPATTAWPPPGHSRF